MSIQTLVCARKSIDNSDDTFDSGSHINIDVTDVINVIPWSSSTLFLLTP